MSAFHARILASDTLFFDGDCEFMVVPCTDGAMGILSHHSNMIAAVVPRGSCGFSRWAAAADGGCFLPGLVKVEAGEVMLLVSTAERPEDLTSTGQDGRRTPQRRPFCKRKVCRSTGTRRPSWPGPSAVCGPKNTGTTDAEL